MHRSRNSTVENDGRRRGRLAAAAVMAAGLLMTACVPPPEPAPTDPTPDPTPSIAVSNTTGLAATGSTVTVTGQGFDPAIVEGSNGTVGVYVALGRGASTTVPEVYTSAKFVRPTGPSPETSGGAKINTDGTFSATIPVSALFSASNSSVNCYVDSCSIYVFSAHTGSYAPWTFTKTPVIFQAPTAPMVAVSKTTGLDPAGQNVTVTGAGFAATAPGIYVVFGPVDTSTPWWLDASAFGDAKYLTGSAIGANGTFTTTLKPVASYVGSSPVDCSTASCAIATMKAHGSTDRSQDTVTPVTFLVD
ncbi:MAG: IPT/TIG domain-containing protein [Microthrixaceae bacterium]